MFEVKEIINPDEKSAICDAILRALPSWFEIEESIVDYARQVKAIPQADKTAYLR